MPPKPQLDIQDTHVTGNFKWATEPSCCEQLIAGLEAKFVFVSNTVDFGSNIFYLMPLDSDGNLARSRGIQISFCPWCGAKLKGKKATPIG